MAETHTHVLPFGAEPHSSGNTRFRIWAPSCDHVRLHLRDGATTEMNPQGDGWFELTTEAPLGTRYKFVLPDGLEVPDPASRLQDGDVHGWSVVFDAVAHEWHDIGPDGGDWMGRPWHETVLLEVHAGVMGGFKGVAQNLERWRDLGFTAIELMPLNGFPGKRGWGYDGVLPYAPDEAYGSPGELKALIDRAHALGLQMFLDVVYNHFGPDGAYVHVYAGGKFFDESRHSPWGAAIVHEDEDVRDYFIENAIYWLNEYRFDGLRFDAVGAILDLDFPGVMARRIRAAIEPGRHVHLVVEHEHNRASLLTPDQFDAQWNDDIHHAFHNLLTGETEGYYADYADGAAQLARCLSEGFAFQGEVNFKGDQRGEPSGDVPPTGFVSFIQNHDQIGNRALGDRLTSTVDPEALRAAQAMLLLCPQIPLLFMGEEYGSQAPFPFFTDHHDELAVLVREGRRKEFAGFPAFSDERKRERIPDPNAIETFMLASPDPVEEDPETTLHIRLLLGLRHAHLFARIPGGTALGAGAIGDKAVIARWQMGDGAELVIAMNLGAAPVRVDPAPDGSRLFESHPGDAAKLSDGSLPPMSTVAFLLERT